MDARGPLAASRAVRLAAALVMAVAPLGTPGPGHTQIVRDGTVGPGVAVQPTGPNYVIPDTFGARAGANLFHSFQTFTLQTGQSATFTGPNDISNVISGVTGGERSTIDGLLRSQVGRADFWFINPSGVMFGPHAQIDVPAAFHVGTADEVRFADGARFSASDPAASRLTVAPPEAFGFLRPNPAAIAVNGSQLETKPGQTLSLAGGDLQVTGGKIASPGGRVNLAATGSPGTVQTATGTSSTLARGAVRLAQGAQVDSSGPGGGQITIRGGQIEVTGSDVTADNTSAQDARHGIAVAGDTVRVVDNSRIASSTRGRGKAGNVAVTARAVELYNGAQIGSFTEAQGKAGSVSVRAGNIELQDRGQITSETSGPGQAGDVVVRASGSLTVASNTRPAGDVDTSTASDTYIGSDTYGPGAGHAGSVIVEAGQLRVVGNGGLSYTGIFSGAYENGFGRPTGNAGNVTVNAGRIELRNGGQISTNTEGTGNAGEITIQTQKLQAIGNGSRETFGRSFTGINSIAEQNSSGNAGHVTVLAGDLELHYSGLIGSDTYGPGHAGRVAVTADRLLISGDGSSGFTGITNDTVGSGTAGPVTVTAHDSLVVRDGGQITSETYSRGNAGRVSVTASGSLDLISNARFRGSDTYIGSDTYGPDAGNAGVVAIQAGQLRIVGDGDPNKTGIFSGAHENRFGRPTGNAGDVTVNAGRIELRNGGQIGTDTESTGTGGKVTVTGRDIEISDAGRITSETYGRGDAGRVSVTASGSLDLISNARFRGSDTYIGSDTYGPETGNAGVVAIQAGQLRVVGDSGLSYTGIFSGTYRLEGGGPPTGNAGNVTVNAGRIELRNGGQISTNTEGTGNAGEITIQAQKLQAIGNGSRETFGRSFTGINSIAEQNSSGAGGAVVVNVGGGDIVLSDGAVITTQSESPQHAGNVIINADGSLSLTGGARIASSATQADAGRITITTPGALRLSESAITTEATQGEGGQIDLRVGRLIGLFSGSQITTAATGTGSMGNAGNITIDPQILVVDRDSRIKADAREGNGGRIDLIAENILVWPPLEERITARSERGISGQVNIYAPNQDIGGTLAPLPSGFLDARALLPPACAARLGESKGSLRAAVHAAIVPADPNRLLLPSFLSYTGHQPPGRTAPSGGGEAGMRDAAPGAELEPAPAGAGRLSFACGI